MTTTRVAHSPETAEADLRALVRDIGPGFHPDTRGADYVNLPPRWEIRRDRIDETVAAAIDHGLDPYAIAIDVLQAQASPWIAKCREHPYAAAQVTETGYTRTWHVGIDEAGNVDLFDDRFDLESGKGDDHFECSTCLAPLASNIDFNEVTYS